MKVIWGENEWVFFGKGVVQRLCHVTEIARVVNRKNINLSVNSLSHKKVGTS